LGDANWVRIPLQSIEANPGLQQLITEKLHSSRGVIFPFGVFTSAALSRTLVTQSLFALGPISHNGLNLEAFAPHSLKKYLSRGHPPLGLHSPTEFHRACPCSLANKLQLLSWGSAPYGAYGHPEPTHPGVTTPSTLRLQVFSTS